MADRTYEILEDLYAEYNRREYVSPDPLEFLYLYDDPADREVVGLVASSFAYGRVASILSSVRKVLDVLGPHPADALGCMSERSLAERLSGFRHRFSGDREVAKFLYGIGCVLKEYGSLENLFCAALADGDRADGVVIVGAMERFAREILMASGMEMSHLLPLPSKGSACKRLSLYVRWMVRSDDVDPGGWNKVPRNAIMVPLDTHMFKIATGLGFVKRKSPDGKAAVEATEGFRSLNPEDPEKDDFALTRFGIRTGLSVGELLEKFHR
jgi:uncharacterized protein (TIGR02757 family)